MPQKIQIKRSATSASPLSLDPGELAYSEVNQRLYIGETAGFRNLFQQFVDKDQDNVITGDNTYTGVNDFEVGDLKINGIAVTTGSQPATLLTTQDLNSITSPGNYYTNNSVWPSPSRNYPDDVDNNNTAETIIVVETGGGLVKQTAYYEGSSGGINSYVRMRRPTGYWFPWKEANAHNAKTLNNENLNNLKTEGHWNNATSTVSNATTANSYPPGATEGLGALKISELVNYVIQEYTYMSADGFTKRYLRRFVSSWSAWKKQATEDDLVSADPLDVDNTGSTIYAYNADIEFGLHNSTNPTINAFGSGDIRINSSVGSNAPVYLNLNSGGGTSFGNGGGIPVAHMDGGGNLTLDGTVDGEDVAQLGVRVTDLEGAGYQDVTYTHETTGRVLVSGDNVAHYGGATTYTLPTAGNSSPGDLIRLIDAAATSSSGPITVNRSDNLINGSASNYTLNVNGAEVVFRYSDVVAGWVITKFPAQPVQAPMSRNYTEHLTATGNVSVGTAFNNNHYIVNVPSATVELSLPTKLGGPSFGWIVRIADVSAAGSRASKAWTIARNGQNIMGLAEDMVITTDFATVEFIFVGGATGWAITNK